MPATATPTRVIPYPDVLSLAVEAATAALISRRTPQHQAHAAFDVLDVEWFWNPVTEWSSYVKWERCVSVPVGGPILRCAMCDDVLRNGRRYLCPPCEVVEMRSGEPF